MNDKQSPDELKACPFCGGKAKMTRETPTAYWKGVCWKGVCGCEGPDAKEKEDAIKLWNTRTPDLATLQRRAEEAEDMLETMKRLDCLTLPCGHNSQYGYSPDGIGKQIICTVCSLDSVKKQIAEKDGALKELKRALCGEVILSTEHINTINKALSPTTSDFVHKSEVEKAQKDLTVLQSKCVEKTQAWKQNDSAYRALEQELTALKQKVGVIVEALVYVGSHQHEGFDEGNSHYDQTCSVCQKIDSALAIALEIGIQ